MAKEDIKLRLATVNDAKALARFARGEILRATHYNMKARKAYSAETTAALMEEIIKRKGFAAIAEVSGKPVACMWATFDPDDMSIIWFEWVLVAEQYKQQGLAKRMHVMAEHRATVLGARKIWGDSRASNYQAIALEKSLGIRRIGILRHHWFGQDYILWEKELSGRAKNAKRK